MKIARKTESALFVSEWPFEKESVTQLQRVATGDVSRKMQRTQPPQKLGHFMANFLNSSESTYPVTDKTESLKGQPPSKSAYISVADTTFQTPHILLSRAIQKT